MDRFIARYVMVALSVVGSAILLFSCEREEEPESESQIEMMMTEYSENLSVVMSQNGRRSYHFKTPLLEGYSLAREPYREFPKGVEMTTYKNDSLSSVDAVLTANYAIHYETRDLWEARGNVVVEKSDGKKLYTQQLFWNARTKKIYSNVDSKIVQNDGRDVFIGEGFESDEEFKDWRFRRMKGRMEVEVKPNESDSRKAPHPRGRSHNSPIEESICSISEIDIIAALSSLTSSPSRNSHIPSSLSWKTKTTFFFLLIISTVVITIVFSSISNIIFPHLFDLKIFSSLDKTCALE